MPANIDVEVIGNGKVPCIESAIVYAASAHYGQIDREGIPYIHHPLRVMEAIRTAGYTVRYQIVGLLHDVVEDTDATLDEVEMYFGDIVASGVDAVTRRDGEGYFGTYLPRCFNNRMGTVAKYFDARDNHGRGALKPGEDDKYTKVQTRAKLRMVEMGIWHP